MKLIYSLCLACLMCIGCTVNNTVIPETHEPEKTDYQTHIFQGEDQILVMNAILQAYYNQGFLIYSAQEDIGVITADLVLEPEYYTEEEIIVIWYAPKRAKAAPSGAPAHIIHDEDLEWWVTEETIDYAVYEELDIIESSAHVVPYYGGSKVLVHFQRRILDSYGETVKVEQIDDEDFYAEFYSLVNENILDYYKYNY